MITRQRLECKSPLLLFFLRSSCMPQCIQHIPYGFATRLECGSPLPLFFRRKLASATTFYPHLTYDYASALGVQKSSFAFTSYCESHAPHDLSNTCLIHSRTLARNHKLVVGELMLYRVSAERKAAEDSRTPSAGA